ncbi:esterase/lipase [Desulfosporosinus acidiphilus SJ4]|uniref:Esterase/lipase n=1 Tax=Desulfosporosinus acidiphilus (strain DSM 22704 / JCM 16185 / SJ4) TaxID=646529 RepID=I4DC82_DESAJ|nr:alpha/beta fold hydrolase [Desulfosporosinus acidiphilus]AFM43406.1 esterase/lipase [Desulfosporosinus acidiphilus SJ4]
MKPKKRLVEPFYFPGNSLGCLLIHGFSGSPSEMRYLGEQLSGLGWTVLGIRLAGHGSTPEQMAKTRWEDWVRDAEAGVKELRKSCSRVIGIGLSMGGLLVLHLATLDLIDGIVSMNSPMLLADRRTRYVRLIRPFRKFVAKPNSRTNGQIVPEESKSTQQKPERFVYDKIPVDSLISLNKAIGKVRRELKRIKCPALLMQSRKDFTVDPISVQLISKNINARKSEVLFWEHSGHILTLGPERDEVVRKVDGFLQEFNNFNPEI